MNPEDYPLTGNIEEDLAALAKIRASQEKAARPSPDLSLDPFTLLNKGATKALEWFGQGALSPEGAQDMVNFGRDAALAIGLNLAMPGSGMLARLARPLAQGALAGGTAALEGKPQSDIATAASLGLVGQGAGELGGAAGRVAIGQSAAKGLFKNYEAKQKAAEEANKFALEKYGTDVLDVGARNAFGGAMGNALEEMYKDKGAATLAKYIKSKVPEFSTIPEDTKGLLDMVYGQGQGLLSEAFDKAVQKMEGEAAGKIIQISPEAAAAFKIKSSGGLSQQQVNNLLKGGVSPEAIRRMGGGGDAGYDAQQAIRSIIGKQSKYPREYREVVDALEEAGLKNEQTAPYKTAQAWINYIDKMKGLEGEQYHPDRMLQGLTQLKKLNEIRRRGEGDIFRGPLQELRDKPVEFAAEELPKKPIPVSVEAPDIKESPFFSKMLGSHAIRFGSGAGPAAMAAHLAGLPYSHYAPWVIGSGALSAGMLPKTIYKNVPLSPSQSDIAELLPLLMGGMGAAGLRQFGP